MMKRLKMNSYTILPAHTSYILGILRYKDVMALRIHAIHIIHVIQSIQVKKGENLVIHRVDIMFQG